MVLLGVRSENKPIYHDEGGGGLRVQKVMYNHFAHNANVLRNLHINRNRERTAILD